MSGPDFVSRRELLRCLFGCLALGSTAGLAGACSPGGDWKVTDSIEYLSWDRARWTAGISPVRMHKLSTDDPGFRFAPGGDRSHAHAGEHLDYYGSDSKKWRSILVAVTTSELFRVNEVKITFVHAPEGNWDRSQHSDSMAYLDWQGTAWEAKVHQIGVTGDPEGHSYLNLNWSVRRYRNGVRNV
jgi:hypothetical protein